MKLVKAITAADLGTFPGPSVPTPHPHDPRGTHRSHCCKQHGCKYGAFLTTSKRPCPVESGDVVQDHECEQCDAEREELAEGREPDLPATESDELLHRARELVALFQARGVTSVRQALGALVELADVFNELDYRMTELGRSAAPSDWR